jgi:hypothetical protein
MGIPAPSSTGGALARDSGWVVAAGVDPPVDNANDGGRKQYPQCLSGSFTPGTPSHPGEFPNKTSTDWKTRTYQPSRKVGTCLACTRPDFSLKYKAEQE